MISENIVRRTYAVKCGEDIGAAVVIDFNHKRYLVSANHVFSSYASTKKFFCLHKQGWIEVKHTYVVHGGSSELIDDFIVFEITEQLQEAPSLEVAAKSDTWIAQDVLALGYPILTPSPLWNGNAGFATGFVKRGIVSSVVSSGGFDSLFIFDLLLNRGMSGGPVLSIGYGKERTFKLIAIGVGYYSPGETIQSNGGKTIYNANSGLAFGIPIERIMLAIKNI
jgi:S1-C subfamily serine protease